MTTSLGDYLLDRTESLNDDLILEYFIARNDDKIARLLDKEQYLLEGSRGAGKTMLMKTAMLRSLEEFGKNSVLPVWISFEESIRLERIAVIDNTIDPFLQWTMGKILSETLKMILKIKPDCIDELNERLSKIFGQNTVETSKKYSELLTDYINILEKAEVKDSLELKEKTPSQELISILDNTQSFKEFILTLVDDFDLTRIVFLFDEAAHVFSYPQQEKFFTFFKSLRDPKIACKAAVYPGITNYGKYFERGQDAKELQITWKSSDDGDLKYIKNILKKRIQEFNKSYWDQLTVDKEIIDTICICSNGNPRFSFHIIDELENSKCFGKKITTINLINAIRKVFNTKWTEFSTLKHRLVKFEQHIVEAEKFMKETLIPNLRVWNNKRREKPSKLSNGIYVSTKAYEELDKLFSILDYSNLISVDHSKKSLGHNKYGYFVSINPSLIFTDLILKDVSEFKNTSVAIENNQAYYDTTSAISDIADRLHESTEFTCSNISCEFKTTDETFSFCPQCGGKIKRDEPQSLYKILRSHNIKSLKQLSSKIHKRLETKFNNIGEIYDSELNDIRMKYIQDVRIEKVKNAAIEYMAG